MDITRVDTFVVANFYKLCHQLFRHAPYSPDLAPVIILCFQTWRIGSKETISLQRWNHRWNKRPFFNKFYYLERSIIGKTKCLWMPKDTTWRNKTCFVDKPVFHLKRYGFIDLSSCEWNSVLLDKDIAKYKTSNNMAFKQF